QWGDSIRCAWRLLRLAVQRQDQPESRRYDKRIRSRLDGRRRRGSAALQHPGAIRQRCQSDRQELQRCELTRLQVEVVRRAVRVPFELRTATWLMACGGWLNIGVNPDVQPLATQPCAISRSLPRSAPQKRAHPDNQQ